MTMKEQDALEQLRRVFVAYPSYRQWARDTGYGDETIDAWVGILRGCDLGDVRDIVDEIVAGKREPTGRYEKADAMPRNIASEARDRRAKRNRRETQQTKYHSSMENLRSSDPKFRTASHESIRLGNLVRSGKLTRGENDDRMAVLLDWYKSDGPLPHWMGESS